MQDAQDKPLQREDCLVLCLFSFGGILCSFRTFSALNAMNGRFTFPALSGGGEEGASGG